MRASLARRFGAWQVWLFAPSELRPLAWFRIGWSVAMLVATSDEWQRYSAYGLSRYHVPLASWATPLSESAFHTLLRVAIVGSVMTLLGLLPQLGAIVTVAAHGYLFASDLLQFRNHIYLGLLLGSLLALSPCGRVLALDSLVRRLRGRNVAVVGANPAGQLMKAQVLLVYAWAVVTKLRVSFLDGFTLQQELPHALHASPIAAWLHTSNGALRPAISAFIANDRATAFCSCALVAVEAFLCFGLARRRWQRVAVCLGVVLHASILVLMSVVTFSLLMVASYPLFLGNRRSSGP